MRGIMLNWGFPMTKGYIIINIGPFLSLVMILGKCSSIEYLSAIPQCSLPVFPSIAIIVKCRTLVTIFSTVLLSKDSRVVQGQWDNLIHQGGDTEWIPMHYKCWGMERYNRSSNIFTYEL